MFKTITAKFAGTCRRCGGAIEAGQRMRWGGRGLTYHLASDCESESNSASESEWESGRVHRTARGVNYDAREVDPEYESARLRGHYDYQDERGVWHLE